MSTTIPEDLIDSLFSVQESIVRPIATLSVTYFVYGFYALLFGTYIYMMCNDHQKDHRNLNLALAVVLFGLSTAFIVVYTVTMVDQSISLFTAVKTRDSQPFVDYLTQDPEKIAFLYLVPILLNIAAEYILIHRCYVIWSSRKRVILPLIAAAVLTNIFGVAGAIMLTISVSDPSMSLNRLYFIGNNVNFAHSVASLVVNFTLTLLTAGRIWWIHRQVRALGVSASDTLVQSVSRIILESGSLYPIMSIIGLIMMNTIPLGVLPFDFSPLVALSAGIAPTLTMVRVKLGRNVETLQDQVSDIRFTSRQAPQEGISSRSQTQVYSVGNISVGRVDTGVVDGKETIVV